VNETSTPPADEGVWERLRRRKLVQWGVAYAAGAWGFQQGVAYVSTLLGWPVQVQRLTGLALLIGLPIALVLAWYHGDRGQRQVTRSELAILTLLFLLGGGIFWYFQRASETSTATSPAPTAAALPTDASIAVLPFVNMSTDKDQEYFADGISEELLNLLAQVPELRVIARTSSFSFKGKDVEIAEIARRLNVANVLEGSVRKSGDKLRITAQLVRASDSSHLWSKTYDRNMADVFAVQDEIAAAVVSELKIKLLGVALKPREADPRSYVLFLQARDINRQVTAAASRQAIGLYEQALALDPSNTAAWVGLADALVLEVASGWRQADDGIPLARNALEKALAIDAEYAHAHSLLAKIAVLYDLDYAAAVQHLERALTLAPGDAEVVGAAGFVARRIGRIEDAIRLFEYQVDRDPLNFWGHEQLGIAKSRAGRLDEAIAALRTVLSLAPRSIAEHYYIGEAYLRKGDGKAALAEMKLEPDEQWRLPGLSMAYHSLGMSSEADHALAELIQKYPRTAAVSVAMVLAFRGDTDAAFQWLDKAVQYHDITLGSIPLEPMFVNLHSDPRWLTFLREHGMAPDQLAAIKFDVKLPK
jgi:TolB-like protein/cytochrome c-type biogenesis protein CcmH/NrfG